MFRAFLLKCIPLCLMWTAEQRTASPNFSIARPCMHVQICKRSLFISRMVLTESSVLLAAIDSHVAHHIVFGESWRNYLFVYLFWHNVVFGTLNILRTVCSRELQDTHTGWAPSGRVRKVFNVRRHRHSSCTVRLSKVRSRSGPGTFCGPRTRTSGPGPEFFGPGPGHEYCSVLINNN